MRLRAAGIVACGLIVGLAAAGCGGGDEGGDQPLTKQEFVDQGNRICIGINQGIRDAAANLPASSTPAEAKEGIINNVLPVITDGISQVGDLNTDDPAIEKKADEMVSATDEAAAKLKADPKAVVSAAAVAGNPLQEAANTAEELGLNKCFPDLQSTSKLTPGITP